MSDSTIGIYPAPRREDAPLSAGQIRERWDRSQRATRRIRETAAVNHAFLQNHRQIPSARIGQIRIRMDVDDRRLPVGGVRLAALEKLRVPARIPRRPAVANADVNRFLQPG